MMKSTVSVLVYVAVMLQAQASAYTTPRINDAVDLQLPDSDGDNVVLEPDMDSVLAALELVRREQSELRQRVQQSQAQVASALEQLRQENSQLRQQQQAMLDDLSLAVKEHDDAQAQQLSELQQRMDRLESLLPSVQRTMAPSTTLSTTPLSTTPPPTTTFISPTTSSDDGQRLQFTLPPDDDIYGDSLMNSILVTSGGKLIVGDQFQNVLKMSSMQSPAEVEDVYSIDTPWSMLELEDGTIAVTAEYKHKIQILRIANNRLEHVRDITTEKTYFGIAQGPLNTLIVSDRKSDYANASLEVIDMDGDVLTTLLTDGELLINPFRLARYGDDVYVTDWTSQRVFRVNVGSGETSFIIGDLDLSDLDFEQPRSIDVDSDGNLYIATGGKVCKTWRGWCVVQVSQSGSWKMMENYVAQRGAGYPYGLAVTSSQIIISWAWWDDHWSSELTAYTLPQQQGHPDYTAHPDHQGSHTSCVFTLKASESGRGSNTSSGRGSTSPPPQASSTPQTSSAATSAPRETTTEFEEYDWSHDEYYNSVDQPT